MAHHDQYVGKTGLSSRTKWILIGFFAVGAFFLLTEHRAHLYGALPYLLILACPLMHLFHGHGSHGGSHEHGKSPTDPSATSAGRVRVDKHDHGREQS